MTDMRWICIVLMILTLAGTAQCARVSPDLVSLDELPIAAASSSGLLQVESEQQSSNHA